MDSYTDDKKTELDTYTGVKKTELDTYEGTKEAELNTYASGLKDAFDTNATSKTNAFNNNATAKTTAFDTNASTKTSAFDDNATAKTTAFNENAEEKTGDFNDNVDTKTAEFDAHVVEKETEFDENVDSIQEQITDIQEFIDSELEQGITEKGTRADVSDSAKWYGELAPEGRTEQTQLQGYNLFDYTQVNNLAYGSQDGITKILRNASYRGYYIPVAPGEHYYISRKNTTDFSRFRICYTEVEPTPGREIIENSQGTRDTYTSFDTVVPEDARYLFLYLSNNNEDITTEAEVQITKSEELLPYEPYVGGQASPSPDYPQEIRNVEGRSTTNLVKVATDNSLNSNTGGYGNYSINDATHEVISTGKTLMGFKVKVEPSTQYSIQYLLKDTDDTIIKNMRVREYSAEPITSTDWSGESFITQSVNDSASTAGYKRKTFTTQENTQWILFIFYSNGGNTTVAEWQVNKGSTLLSYEPYFEGKRLEFNVCNKNLFDENTVEFIDGLLDDNGQPIAGGSHYTSNFYRVKPSLIYKILGTTTSGASTKRIYFYDINKNWISRSQQMGLNNVQFTTPDNCYYIRLQVSNAVTLKTGDVMLCEGIDDTYVEHNQQLIPFPMQEGQKLMEGDYLADDGVHHVKNIVDMSTLIYSFVSSNDTFQVTISDIKRQIAGTTFKGKATSYSATTCATNTKWAEKSNGTVGLRSGSTIEDSTHIVCFKDNRFVNATDFKNAMANNYLLYELEQEIVDQYTPAQAEAYNKLKNLKLYKGVNHIWTNTDGLEPNLQLTYYKSNKERLNNIEARLELLEN